MLRTITVGLDGSRESRAAAEWAAREAGLRGLPLKIVHVWEPVPEPMAQAPLLGDDASLNTDDPGPEARERSVFRVILDGWGVPDRDRDGLAAEFEQAGFVDVRWVGGGAAGPLRIVARKP